MLPWVPDPGIQARAAGACDPRRQPKHPFVGTQPRARGCYRRATVRTKGVQRGRVPLPLRAVVRARCLRVRVRVRHRWPARPRDRPRRPDRPGQPGASRRQRLGAEHRGRRGDPGPGALRLPPIRGRRAGAPPARRGRTRRGGRIRRRDGLPPPRRGEPRGLRGARHRGPGGRRAGPPRLAGRPDRGGRPRRDRPNQPAGHPPGLRR